MWNERIQLLFCPENRKDKQECISEGSPEKQKQQDIAIDTDIDINIDKRFIIGIGSHGYGGQEVPWSAGCELDDVIQFEPEGLRMGVEATDVIGPGLILKA